MQRSLELKLVGGTFLFPQVTNPASPAASGAEVANDFQPCGPMALTIYPERLPNSPRALTRRVWVVVDRLHVGTKRADMSQLGPHS